MNVLVTGSSGLIGRALDSFLTAGGHRVARLVRSKPAPNTGAFFWDPATGTLDPAGLEGFDAVVHLAGENVGERWTAQKKARIYGSRVKGTRLLCESLARLKQPPRVLVSASATGYYGDCREEIVDEEHPPGSDFLAQVCRDWESAAEPAVQRGIRVVKPRIGFVLSAAGGGLARMLTPFKLGLGGTLGSGRQYMSWVAIEDVVSAFSHLLTTETIAGPVNVVAPNPVTNREFTKTLGRVLGRPTLFPVPAFAIRLAFGEMAEDLLLAGARVKPGKLLASSYRFQHSDLEPALRRLLHRNPTN